MGWGPFSPPVTGLVLCLCRCLSWLLLRALAIAAASSNNGRGRGCAGSARTSHDGARLRVSLGLAIGRHGALRGRLAGNSDDLEWLHSEGLMLAHERME